MGNITTITNECFENLIGLRETCTAQSPRSGLMLNQVGVNYDFAKSVLMRDYKTVEDFVDDKIAFATKIVIDRVTHQFSDEIRTTSILTGARAGQHKDNMNLITGLAGQEKGLGFEMCNQESYLDLFISEVNLFTNFTGNIPILVYDLVQKKLLDTLTLVSTANVISTLVVNKLYRSNKKRLDIVLIYDTTGISSYDTAMTLSGCTSCGTQGSTIQNSYVRASSVKFNSADAKLRENLTFASDTGGMSAIYSVQCNKTDWMCENSNLLALPILYKAASEIYLYASFSSRDNSTTMISPEVIDERYKHAEAAYVESIDDLMKRIRLPKDRCFSCNVQSKHAIILP
jgi:hypothetical protein